MGDLESWRSTVLWTGSPRSPLADTLLFTAKAFVGLSTAFAAALSFIPPTAGQYSNLAEVQLAPPSYSPFSVAGTEIPYWRFLRMEPASLPVPDAEQLREELFSLGLAKGSLEAQCAGIAESRGERQLEEDAAILFAYLDTAQGTEGMPDLRFVPDEQSWGEYRFGDVVVAGERNATLLAHELSHAAFAEESWTQLASWDVILRLMEEGDTEQRCSYGIQLLDEWTRRDWPAAIRYVERGEHPSLTEMTYSVIPVLAARAAMDGPLPYERVLPLNTSHEGATVELPALARYLDEVLR
ncbi:hypothetical protein J4439_01605 [Candidatus Woesearchaeota archaeon]|nr:hypothetical protein [Candidatus Woesearchaeota archaeon]